MSTGVRVPLLEARVAALQVVDRLAPACEQIEIAGSIRRGKPDVGDIEIVTVPRFAEEPDGLFATTSVNQLTRRVDELIADRFLAAHPTDPKRGDRYSKVVHVASGLQVDLFSATADTWGLMLLIRTGPADYSHRFVTDLRRRGLHVGGAALHRGGLGCGAYTCEAIATPTENHVYAAAGWAYLPPERRA